MKIEEMYQENKEIQAAQDSIYGNGATAYIGRAIGDGYENKRMDFGCDGRCCSAWRMHRQQ